MAAVLETSRNFASEFLLGNQLGGKFIKQFEVAEEKQKKPEKKSSKKRTKKSKEKLNSQREKVSECFDLQPPWLDIYGNPSEFTVYSHVRKCVQEAEIKLASQIYLQSVQHKQQDGDSDEDGGDQVDNLALKLPKIVGLGLCGVFELIRETKTSHPLLCVRALQALLDLLQGQTPEGLKSEPADVIESLYALLMDLATSQTTTNKSSSNDGDLNHSLTSLACACLTSLVIARNDTGKYLSALTSLIMSPPSIVGQDVKVPHILTSLQKSVHAVLLGKTVIPDWFNSGVKEAAKTSTIAVKPTDTEDAMTSAIASDGNYLYIHNSKGLHKIGSGYAGTVRAHIYSHNPNFHPKDHGWLAYAQSKLFYRSLSSVSNTLKVVDRDSLQEVCAFEVEGEGYGPNVMFSDGDNIGHVASAKDDSFVVRTFSPLANPMPLLNELPLKLARKCMDVFGTASFDTEVEIHSITTGMDEEPVYVTAGKEFGFIRSANGKILYTGKSQVLGIKQGGPSQGKWAELPITKSPKISSCAVGHEGQHALLLAEDGSVFFVGTSRRGEDGDGTKARRQPKPVKPKKMIKLEGKPVTQIACNSGTSAVVTKEGELFMFGKDTSFCDQNSGYVSDLKEVVVSSVSLGKAHAVVLTNKGHIYTFGVNNKGQCGRDYVAGATREMSTNVTMADEEEEKEEEDFVCPTGKNGKHKWKHDQCMVCTSCSECTGYGGACINAVSEGRIRNPGVGPHPCGCGSGDSGCSECGVCRTCAGEVIDPDEDDEGADGGLLEIFAKSRDVIPLDLIIGRSGARNLDQLSKKLEERRQKLKSRSGKSRSSKASVAAAAAAAAAEATGELEPDHVKMSSLGPGKVDVGVGELSVTQVACGLQHTVLLLENGDAYSFGSNHYGQLGVGDNVVRGSPTRIPVKGPIIQVAAGSNHTVLLSANGQVYTCGSHKEGQLGRPSPQEDQVKEKKGHWYAVATLLPGIGSKHGRRATWIGASGSQTYLRIDESLINAHTLSRSSIVANLSCLGLIPMTETGSSMKCLMISRSDGSCKSFSDNDQASLYNQSVCVDPLYDVLWSYSPNKGQIGSYSVLKPESRDLKSALPSLCDISSPELMVPVRTGFNSTRSHMALHMLGCLDTLTSAQQLGVSVLEEEKEKQPTAKVYSKEDFSVVNRFESHGGGWGYSGHSIEAIRFMVDSDVLLGGFGLFGGRGEYFGKIKIFELGPDGGDNEPDGELLVETEEMPYECGAREKYSMLFDEPVLLQANHWYTAWARISGPSSDCGSSGQSSVTTEDQVVFKFKSSKKSNNGTDVNAGQLPQLLYRLPSNDTSSNSRKTEQVEPAHVLSREFSRSVSPECFESLLKLLNWSWNTFCAALHDVRELRGLGLTAALSDLDRLVYISTSSLRLIKIYINEVYPNQGISKKTPAETTKLAECVGDTRSLLKKILADSHRQIALQNSTTKLDSQANHVHTPEEPTNQMCDNVPPEGTFQEMARCILDQCHLTFTACYHAFYPTGSLKWNCLCELLSILEPVSYQNNVEGLSCLLAAVMEALCHPTVKLSSIMPINYQHLAEKFLQSTYSTDDNTPSLTNHGDSSQFPLLVAHMMERAGMEGMGGGAWNFREMLDKLLGIVVLPVRQALHKEKTTYPSLLISNTCSLLAALISELAASATGSDTEITPPSRPLLITPNRFTRTSTSAFWNTGQGSPDAVCFSVDRSGIVIAGVGLYAGQGQYDYEIDLLDELGESAVNEPSHTGRWSTLTNIKGTYGSAEDCLSDTTEIKFDKPIPIKESKRYAIRLRNKGPRTLNGDTGLNKVKCPDGTTFTFIACSLSSNGTNHTRGQIPQILYYSTPQEGENSAQNSRLLAEYQARKNVMTVASSVFRVATDLLHRAHGTPEAELEEALGNAEVFSTLLPLLVAHVAPVVSLDPKGAVQTLSLIQEILPSVAHINSQLISPATIIASPNTTLNNPADVQQPQQQPSPSASAAAAVNNGNNGNNGNNVGALSKDPSTTSQHYAIVESDHPYKPATVANYKVTFPDNVKWMVLEFDPQCASAQNEDSLQLYIPAKRDLDSFRFTKLDQEHSEGHAVWWPVLKRFHGVDAWPTTGVILPGNEVCFSLETASDYVKDEKSSCFGFKCMVIGYEWTVSFADGLRHLEKEITYLGSMCAGSLMRKDIILPPTSTDDGDEDYDTIEEGAQQVFNAHSTLLSKGFALSEAVSINQALDGNLPFCWTSNERTFLKDFVNCSAGTSGGRLAAWLQPESYLDPRQCDIVYSKDEMKCSWPASLTVQTKDQYGKLVNVANLKVEVKAVPVIKDTMERKKRSSRVDADSNLVFGGHPPPKLDTPYQISMKDKKDAFHAICMMKAYENYSFEELRYAAPIVRRPSENMLVRANSDGTYTCNWTPGTTGWYDVHVTLDGFEVGEVFKLEVKDPPHGVTPPTQNKPQKLGHHQNRMRKFVGKWSAGLRVRVHPSLQSEQIGIVKPEGIITFIDELHNDDGVWVRLNQESMDKWCSHMPTNSLPEAWALQYNQQLGKTLLVPVEEPKSLMDEIVKASLRKATDANNSRQNTDEKEWLSSLKDYECPATFQVVKCGPSGHNIRCRPALKATPIGVISHGSQVVIMEHITNPEGTWIKMDDDSKEQYCHDLDGEAWCLSRSHDGIVYVQHESAIPNEPLANITKGFDFSAAQHTPTTFNSFSPTQVPAFGASGASGGVEKSPFVFGQPDPADSNTKYNPVPLFGIPPSMLPSDKSSHHHSHHHISHREKSRILSSSSSRGSSRESSPTPGGSGSSHHHAARPGSPLVAAAMALGPPPKPPERKESLSKDFTKDLANISSDIPPELQGVSVKDLIKALGKFHLGREITQFSKDLPQRPTKKVDLVADLKKISVKDIIRVLGESRVNGNGVTPPRTPPGTPKKSLSRSNSPKPLNKGPSASGSSPRCSPLLGRRDMGGPSGIPTLSPRSTPPATPPSTPPVTRRLSENRDFVTPPQTPPRSSPRPMEMMKPKSPQRSLSSSPQRSGSPLAVAPRPHSSSPVRLSAAAANAAKQQAESALDPKGLFSIGSASPKEDALRVSPKSSKKDRSKVLRSKRERAVSPGGKDKSLGSRSTGSKSGSSRSSSLRKPVKEAMSPSVSQCMRAVFAAFMWHEGIVHDAMACASFIKFHPSLIKDSPKAVKSKAADSGKKDDSGLGSLKSNRGNSKRTTPTSTPSNSLNRKEHSRHSSVSSMSEGSSTNMNVTPSSTPSDSLKSKHSRQSSVASTSNLNINEAIKELSESGSSPAGKFGHRFSTGDKPEVGILGGDEVVFQSTSDLPPTLEYLVHFWEELSASTIKVVNQNLIQPSPASVLLSKLKKIEKNKEKDKKDEKRVKKKKEGGVGGKYIQLGRGNIFGGAADGPFAIGDRIERVDRVGGEAGGGAGGGDRETMCELCGSFFSHPVTYHMKECHPGCGQHAGGQGYNSGGNFCGGWAGNCGDGGAGGSTWYLMCDRCREKYLKDRKNNQKEKYKKMKKKVGGGSGFKQPSPSTQVQEPHLVMKNNAMFLLDLASAAGFSFPIDPSAPLQAQQQPNVVKRRSMRLDSSLPSMTEDLQNAFPLSQFVYLMLRGAQAADSLFGEDVLLSDNDLLSSSQGLRNSANRQADRSPVTHRSISTIADVNPQVLGQMILTSRSAEASPIDGPQDANATGRIMFQRSISEYASPANILGAVDEDEDGEDANYRVNTRRRNNSGSVADGGASLLKHPSKAMEQLIKSAGRVGSLKRSQMDLSLQRPVLAFVMQKHDLESLQLAMRQALRKAACRVYALQAFNWLLRSVTQPTCIHDILWHFVGSLTPPPPEVEEEDEADKDKDKKDKKEQEQDKEILCDHPLSDIAIAGDAVIPLPQAFHSFLQTISDVMMYLPPGSALQQMAVRCWSLSFRATDHMFLHKCHVFSNISKILSKSDEGWGLNTIAREKKQHGTRIECMKDLTGSVEMKASSRAAMIASLTDNSTETFWESGDEDRNKTKNITITCNQGVHPHLVSVHIDNSRDIGNKVTNMVVSGGQNAEDLHKIKQFEIETRHTGWLTCQVVEPEPVSVIKLEMRGPDNNLRLRQIKILGDNEGDSLELGPPHNALVMQQQNCEVETLRVFRLLTSQVFGKLILSGSPTPSDVESMESSYEDVDLREHMVGILFSRSKLTHLQKQVCAHIVQAIRKETLRVREEWEAAQAAGEASEVPDAAQGDAYCFELLSMVLALSGSSVGRTYLAQQHNLTQDLLTLLHTASPRVQRQVTSLLRRILPEVPPQTLANLLGVPSLPPTDFSLSSHGEAEQSPEEFDPRRMGIIDVFLACIAKALTVQVKMKGRGSLAKAGPSSYKVGECMNANADLGSRWWLRGTSSSKLASSMVDLLKDLAAGKLSDTWASVAKGAVAENILALTKMKESDRVPTECIKTPTLWMALASLCVLDKEHVERLSSGRYTPGAAAAAASASTLPASPRDIPRQQPLSSGVEETASSSSSLQEGQPKEPSVASTPQPPQPRPTCDNHDDGETLAIIHCDECANLCADCDRFLHLHRKARHHHRQVFKEEEESIKVDLHEGIGRTKLFWVMCLADSKTNKAMVEFREGAKGRGSSSALGGICRFCGSSGASGMLALGNVCADPDCQQHAHNACTRTHSCGHACAGIRDEDPCLSCLHGCKSLSGGGSLKQDAEDMCMICFTESLSAAPAIQLQCGHVFHQHCCRNVLDKRWVGPRITFGFSLCPICKASIDHPVLKDVLSPIRALYEEVKRKATMRLEYEGLHKAEAIMTEGTRYHNNPTGFAMDRYAYYVCFKCTKAYYGGEARCEEQAGGGDEYDPAELVCGGCSDVSRAQMCPKHGTDFLEYKCRYCCSVAVFFCFGTTHFCNACHDDFQRVTNIVKSNLPHCPAGPKAVQMDGEECPLHVKHPATGEEFALGCGVCRNAHTF